MSGIYYDPQTQRWLPTHAAASEARGKHRSQDMAKSDWTEVNVEHSRHETTAMDKEQIEDRIDTLEQLADAETEDYAAFCRIQSEIWGLRAKLAELEVADAKRGRGGAFASDR